MRKAETVHIGVAAAIEGMPDRPSMALQDYLCHVDQLHRVCRGLAIDPAGVVPRRVDEKYIHYVLTEHVSNLPSTVDGACDETPVDTDEKESITIEARSKALSEEQTSAAPDEILRTRSVPPPPVIINGVAAPAALWQRQRSPGRPGDGPSILATIAGPGPMYYVLPHANVIGPALAGGAVPGMLVDILGASQTTILLADADVLQRALPFPSQE
ncbi:MAG: hypothetical protein J0H15_04750 [Xanthomonadales bacterium]|nr:hypothetical protein [Xanthomonadales bacterium]